MRIVALLTVISAALVTVSGGGNKELQEKVWQNWKKNINPPLSKLQQCWRKFGEMRKPSKEQTHETLSCLITKRSEECQKHQEKLSEKMEKHEADYDCSCGSEESGERGPDDRPPPPPPGPCTKEEMNCFKMAHRKSQCKEQMKALKEGITKWKFYILCRLPRPAVEK